jgi:AcrR family transcriptional regulator
MSGDYLIASIPGDDGPVPTTGAGRPRLTTTRRPGASPRDEILDASAELFTTRGYGSTSTRSIAEAVGIRQASLYYHFKTKDEILCALLRQTVSPTLEFVEAITRAHVVVSPTEHLHALATYDGAQLLNSRWNLGALYLMPEVRQAALAEFWTERERLRLHYLAVSQSIAATQAEHISEATADLPFRLVEALVNIRTSQNAHDWFTLVSDVADACLRVLGVPGSDITDLRTRTSGLLELAESC